MKNNHNEKKLGTRIRDPQNLGPTYMKINSSKYLTGIKQN